MKAFAVSTSVFVLAATGLGAAWGWRASSAPPRPLGIPDDHQGLIVSVRHPWPEREWRAQFARVWSSVTQADQVLVVELARQRVGDEVLIAIDPAFEQALRLVDREDVPPEVWRPLVASILRRLELRQRVALLRAAREIAGEGLWGQIAPEWQHTIDALVEGGPLYHVIDASYDGDREALPWWVEVSEPR